MRGDKERDELITSALRSYAEPEEIPEARIALARVVERAQEMDSRRSRIWVWLVPVSACAVALLLVGLIWMMRAPRTSQIAMTPPAPAVVSGNVVANTPVKEPRSAPHRPVMRVAAAQPEPLPKLEVFPSPSPLHPEEQALAIFARPSQAAVTQQVLAAQKHIDDPIDIADIKIGPLDIGDNQVPPTGKDKR
jgi:hypothetical protein